MFQYLKQYLKSGETHFSYDSNSDENLSLQLVNHFSYSTHPGSYYT